MTTGSSDDLTFVYLGTTDYHFMILKNIELLRRVYPGCRIMVYDWGDGNGEKSGTVFPAGVEVIDWSDRVKDTWPLMDVYGEKRLIEIGKAYNSRLPGGFRRRATKFFLKRFPGSAIARRRIAQGVRYENLLVHKSYNLRDCSRRLSGKRFFLMDADAYLVDRIDEIFAGDPDVIVPMAEREVHRWDYNNCHGLSTGVMGFGARTAARDAFLGEWYDAVAGNDEWLRELAAMNRLMKSKDPGFFDDWGLRVVRFRQVDVKIRTIENRVYNCGYNYEGAPADFDRVKILHLAGIAQRPHLFEQFIGKVEEVLARRLKVA